jgi:hypothetical protein
MTTLHVPVTSAVFSAKPSGRHSTVCGRSRLALATYQDAGKRGLWLKNRAGLRALLANGSRTRGAVVLFVAEILFGYIVCGGLPLTFRECPTRL